VRRRSENQLVAPAIMKKNGIPQRYKKTNNKSRQSALFHVLDMPVSQIIKWMGSME